MGAGSAGAATRGVAVVKTEVEVVSEAEMIGIEVTLGVEMVETEVVSDAAGPVPPHDSAIEATVADGEVPVVVSEIHMFLAGDGATTYLAGLDPDLALDLSLSVRPRPALDRAVVALTQAGGPFLAHRVPPDDAVQDLGRAPHRPAGMRPSVAGLRSRNPTVGVAQGQSRRTVAHHRPSAVATPRLGVGVAAAA